MRAGAPADDAGMTVGDVITAAGGTAVSSSAELQKAVDAKKPGDTLSLAFNRDGQSKTAEVALAERPA